MKVLVTRAEPAAGKTARRLEASGHEAIIFPIFELQDTGKTIDTEAFDHAVFTSANAARVLLDRGWRNTDQKRIACCVGEQTRKTAATLGFNQFLTASGGGAALTEEIATAFGKSNMHFLYPTTPDRTFDMEAALTELGHRVTTIEVYKTARRYPDPEILQAMLNRCAEGAVIVYSARSGKHLFELLQKTIDLQDLTNLILVGISETAVSLLLDLPWRKAYVADRPDENTMIDILNQADRS